ncbi:G-protein coupled receptor Mth2 [Olea europaea subsp. europaea]|uniref:G-protein coupled receptor Mth2 n=1 Tax=Olea europaea subsp. europaea TaxID=158383 RepID=A0A8S0PCH5_OLEEU|nr:G-protein coupled receptor Mth2 [Olea europaea subsp. europaea]
MVQAANRSDYLGEGNSSLQVFKSREEQELWSDFKWEELGMGAGCWRFDKRHFSRMTDMKRKVRDENNHSSKKGREFKNRKRNNSSSKKKGKEQNRPRHGPRLPNALQKELNLLNPVVERAFSDGEEDINLDDTVGNDVYEYEEGVPEEESKKNKRFDPIDSYEMRM